MFLSYLTLACSASYKLKEKKSQFIGYSSPVANISEAETFISFIKNRHSDATHNCYAYVLFENSVFRSSDDGEPSGTAGVPILSVIQKENLTNCAVVVTRYFGGILLGAGGLVRAYSAAAKGTVTNSGIKTMNLYSVCMLLCSYDQYNKINHFIVQHEGIIKNVDYSAEVCVTFAVKSDKFSLFKNDLCNFTSNLITPHLIKEEFE